MNFSDLPDEIIFEIFYRCDVNTLFSLYRTCKIFHTMMLWSTYLFRDYKILETYIDPLIVYKSLNELNKILGIVQIKQILNKSNSNEIKFITKFDPDNKIMDPERIYDLIFQFSRILILIKNKSKIYGLYFKKRKSGFYFNYNLEGNLPIKFHDFNNVGIRKHAMPFYGIHILEKGCSLFHFENNYITINEEAFNQGLNPSFKIQNSNFENILVFELI